MMAHERAIVGAHVCGVCAYAHLLYASQFFSVSLLAAAGRSAALFEEMAKCLFWPQRTAVVLDSVQDGVRDFYYESAAVCTASPVLKIIVAACPIHASALATQACRPTARTIFV
jgi:hypothetical protein